MKSAVPYLLSALIVSILPATASTTLPFGPLTFGSASDYDSNFKEPVGGNGITWNAAGNISSSSAATSPVITTASAVFDTTATGGSGGSGGTGGSDNNNDLGNFIVSSTISVTNRTGDTLFGYFLRLDANEANGYLALVQVGQGTVSFRVFEGVGLATTSLGTGSIYNSGDISTPTAINTAYNFSVTVNAGTFWFDFNNGAATSNFTDSTVTATVGQTGIFFRTPAMDNATVTMDNFQITAIPEPSAAMLGLLGAASLLRRRR